MNAALTLSASLSAAALLLAGCDQSKGASTSRSASSYSDCLLSAVASGGELEADDVRALCAEATAEPTYKSDQGRAVPANDFTRCYEEQKATLKAKGLTEIERLARVSCVYPGVKQEQ